MLRFSIGFIRYNRDLISSKINFVLKLPHELPNNILEN